MTRGASLAAAEAARQGWSDAHRNHLTAEGPVPAAASPAAVRLRPAGPKEPRAGGWRSPRLTGC